MASHKPKPASHPHCPSGGRVVDRKQFRATCYHQGEDIDPATLATVLANGTAMEGASDADRDWFIANPDRSYLLRPIAAAELAFDKRRRPPDGSSRAAYTLVKQVKPGLRLRIYFISHPFDRVESFSDATCDMLFRVLSLVGGR